MTKTPPLGEWLGLMLEEIDRKHDEAAIAAEERERRVRHEDSNVGAAETPSSDAPSAGDKIA